VLGSALGAQTQQQPRTQDRRPQTADRRPQNALGLQVYVITIGQGAQYWEKYGHNMLAFYDPATNFNVAFNWGTFDFASPDFLKRQLVGDPQYWVDSLPTNLVVDFYTQRDRSVVLQRLAFTPDQVAKALQLAMANVRTENRHYRYDYYRDNCSTRVRDLIDAVLGGALKASTAAKLTPWTYRSETVRLLDDMKFIQLGVTVALGRPADRPLSVWEAGFIPMRLRDALRDMRVAGPNGAPVQLVADERVVYESPAHRDRADNPVLWPLYLIVGLFIAAEIVAMGVVGERKPRLEMVFRLEASAWAFVTGLLGLALSLAWATTQHVFWYRNENLLLFNPLSLWLALLLVLSLRNPRWLRPAAVTSVLVALLSAVGLILHGIPGAGQNSLALVWLVLPAHFAIAFGLWRRSAIVPPAA